MREDTKKYFLLVIMIISAVVLVLRMVDVIDFTIPGWLLKSLGELLS